MDVQVFIYYYREAFGAKAQLPIVFWFSDTAISETPFVGGCFFKTLKDINKGTPVSLSIEIIGCGGGKFYTGFTEMPPFVPNFVSEKEKYKETPEMVIKFIEDLDVPKAKGTYLNFARIDKVNSFDEIEGILFLATPDMLSGLTTWAFYDNNNQATVVTPCGSVCSLFVTQPVLENRRNGHNTFIGFL